MTDPLPSGHRIFDADGSRWVWADDTSVWSDSDWNGGSDDEPAPIDFDAIPTHAELAAGLAMGPVVSLLDEPHAIALPDVIGICGHVG